MTLTHAEAIQVINNQGLAKGTDLQTAERCLTLILSDIAMNMKVGRRPQAMEVGIALLILSRTWADDALAHLRTYLDIAKALNKASRDW
jgi:hypothetical protein